MTRDLTQPITISIGNPGVKNAFVPYKENSNFTLNKADVITFDCFDSNAAAYYLQDNVLKVFETKEKSDASLIVGNYNVSTSTFVEKASFNIIPKEITVEKAGNTTVTTTYCDVLGDLVFGDAESAIGMTAGYRFIAKIKNPLIEAKSDLPSGNIATVSIEGGSSNTYKKDAFEEDGSLIIFTNVTKATTLNVEINWANNATGKYVFEFESVNLVAKSDLETKTTTIALDGTVTLTNNSDKVIDFVLFKENFTQSINAEDSLVITVDNAEEVMYYLNQANKDLSVEFNHITE